MKKNEKGKNNLFNQWWFVFIMLIGFIVIIKFFPNILAVLFGLLPLYTIGYCIYNEIIKKHNYSFNTIIVITIISIICIFFSVIFVYGEITNFNSGTKNTSPPGYEIKNYEVILDVGIDNKVNVTEKIDTYFYGSDKHGIYKFTPYWLEYTGKDGKTIKRKSDIIYYHTEGDTYLIDTVKKKSRIKIGDANRTVNGDKTYIIKYTYDMGRDPFDSFDEFIFHAFGDYWDVPIRNPKVVINMPKGIDGNAINVFTDKYRKENVNSLVNMDISGNSVVITLKDSQYVLNGSLTVDIELPDNYFVGGSYNYDWISFIICMLVLGLTGYVVYIWYKYGKDREKRVPTIEFYAPDDLSSAEVGYIYNRKRITRKLTISLLVQLASKGYIRIDEKKGKNKKDDKIIITDLKKVHDSAIDGLSKCETAVYNNLFTSESEIILNNHKDFYKAFDKVNEILKTKFNKKIYDEEAKKQRKITIIITIITLVLSLLSFFVVEDMDPKLSMMYYASFGCVLINIYLIFIMGRKTDYGEIVSAKIKGFREFLDTAEKDKLESLVEQNPNYFFDILPYTYVLNISKKWIKKFEKIPIKNPDMGQFDYLNCDHVYGIVNDCVHYPEPVSHSSGNSGGCSSCGGGCSSCGGGCSSCGGGGSW